MWTVKIEILENTKGGVSVLYLLQTVKRQLIEFFLHDPQICLQNWNWNVWSTNARNQLSIAEFLRNFSSGVIINDLLLHSLQRFPRRPRRFHRCRPCFPPNDGSCWSGNGQQSLWQSLSHLQHTPPGSWHQMTALVVLWTDLMLKLFKMKLTLFYWETLFHLSRFAIGLLFWSQPKKQEHSFTWLMFHYTVQLMITKVESNCGMTYRWPMSFPLFLLLGYGAIDICVELFLLVCVQPEIHDTMMIDNKLRVEVPSLQAAAAQWTVEV